MMGSSLDSATLARAVIEGHLSRDALPSEHLRWTISSELVSAMQAQLGAGDIEALARYSPTVTVRIERNGRTEILRVPGAVARDLYAAGLPIVVDEHAALVELARGFASALGVPSQQVTCNLFASHCGGTAPMHFDTVCSVAFQLVGRKKWNVRRNDHVDVPIDGWTLGDPASANLRLCTSAAMPSQQLNDCVEEVVNPGDALFVPRGHWHATEAIETSVSVNVHFALPTWADVVLPLIRRMLLSDAEWRSTAPTSVSSVALAQRFASARLKLDELLPDRSTDEPREGYHRIATSTFGIDSYENGTCTVHSASTGGVRAVQLVLPPSALAACSRLSMSASATASSFAATASMSVFDAREVLDALTRAGLLEPCAA